MASLIENYGFIGDLHGSALVSRDGSVDWLCLPRFDSDACMAALLGRDEHGCWTMYPARPCAGSSGAIGPGTLILETDFECEGGKVRLIDFMPFGSRHGSLFRIVEGLEGSVPVFTMVRARFGYGGYRPWITRDNGSHPDDDRAHTRSRCTRRPACENDENDVWSLFTVSKGERVPFELAYNPAHDVACGAGDRSRGDAGGDRAELERVVRALEVQGARTRTSSTDRSSRSRG